MSTWVVFTVNVLVKGLILREMFATYSLPALGLNIRLSDRETLKKSACWLTMTTDWAQLLSCPQTASSFHFKARTGALPPTHPPTYHHHTTCHPISPQQLLHKMKVYK